MSEEDWIARNIPDPRHSVESPRPLARRSWCASPATHVGHELIAAGMLILAGGGSDKLPDYRELERWTRIGFERGMASRRGDGEPPALMPAN